MRKDKEQATELRKQGMSYRQIHYALKIPVSTLSDWFNGEEWSAQIQKRLGDAARVGHKVRLLNLNRIRGSNLTRIYAEARNEARNELEVLKFHPVFVAGVMLYWGEGDKVTRSGVRISNTDPLLLRLFISFLKDVCGVELDAIRASVLIYPDHDETECRRYWSSEIGLPIENFPKSTLIHGKHKTNRLGHGVCMVNVGRAYLKEKLIEWMRLLAHELIRGEYYAKM